MNRETVINQRFALAKQNHRALCRRAEIAIGRKPDFPLTQQEQAFIESLQDLPTQEFLAALCAYIQSH